MADPVDIATSGLVAQRIRMNTIASNIANFSSTRNEFGASEPYVRRRVIFEVGMPQEDGSQGVHVQRIEQDRPGTIGAEPFRLAYDPGHPDANAEGYVRYPNIDLVREFVNALEATRAYEANIQAIEIARSMSNQVSRLLE